MRRNWFLHIVGFRVLKFEVPQVVSIDTFLSQEQLQIISILSLLIGWELFLIECPVFDTNQSTWQREQVEGCRRVVNRETVGMQERHGISQIRVISEENFLSLIVTRVIEDAKHELILTCGLQLEVCGAIARDVVVRYVN